MEADVSRIELALLDSLQYVSQAFARHLVAGRGEPGKVVEAAPEDRTGGLSALPPVAVAYSGGLDSSVLLHAIARQCRAHGISIIAFHVHHGLSPNADQWLSHCAQNCQELGIGFDWQRVEIGDAGKTGIEEAARLQRYRALSELCVKHHVHLLMTAHHQDDQAETVIMQMLRGSGIAGISGIERANTAESLLASPDIVISRPLLSISRAELERYADAHAVEFVQDESNADQRYTRNLIRHNLMPVLSTCFPGFQERLARTAIHARSANSILLEIADQDLNLCRVGRGLDIQKLASFSEARINNVLRHWFSLHDVRMPSTAWLSELRKQILSARVDAQLCVSHPECEIQRYRGIVHIVAKAQPTDSLPENGIAFVWQGQPELFFPSFNGVLYFIEQDEGVSAEWLMEQTLRIRWRHGGERLKLAPNRPSRSLKQHFQALGVPPWIRENLPIVHTQERLLFAAGVGTDCHHFSHGPGKKLKLFWAEHGTSLPI